MQYCIQNKEFVGVNGHTLRYISFDLRQEMEQIDQTCRSGKLKLHNAALIRPGLQSAYYIKTHTKQTWTHILPGRHFIKKMEKATAF